MGEITAKMASEIELPKKGIKPNILQEIRGALIMKNPERVAAEKESIGGWWTIDEHIQLFREDDKTIYIPRGFAEQLRAGFSSYDTKLVFTDSRVSRPVVYDFDAVSVRDYQERAIQSILQNEQGVWEAPPGAGKTVAVLESVRRLGQRALVITDKTNIAEQWRLRARRFLGQDIGLLGDAVWDERDFSVALQQTLWARREELEEKGFFDSWGFICLDECHHFPANTFTDIICRFSAKYRIGVSGTPYKTPGQDDLIWSALGPRFHVTEKSTLREGGWLIKPEVKIWETGFQHPFWSTHFCNTETGDCYEPDCTRPKTLKRHGNNYSEMMTALIRDDYRNDLIATNIVSDLQQKECVVVLSKRLEHLKELEKRVAKKMGSKENLFQFTGAQSTEDRMRIQDRADKGNCVLFSTIADEALDIPRISRIHLVWPTRNTDTTRQQIGRGERPHPEKNGTIIHDYADDVGPLRSQITQRMNEVYTAEGLTISVTEVLVLVQ